ADQRRVAHADVAVDRIGDHTRDCGDGDSGQRGRRGLPRLPGTEKQEQRHDHDASANAEECAEEAGRQADEDEAHGPILATWIPCPAWWRIRRARRSSSTSTGRWHRSFGARRTRAFHPRRKTSYEGSTGGTRSWRASADAR